MGKQNGLVLLTGRLNGIIFYQSGGQYLTRAWDGHSKERIQTDPAFARVRENNNEFGGAAKVAKAFKTAFAQALAVAHDPYVTARLTGVFKKMCAGGQGERGQRNISPRLHPALLAGFEFNPQRPLGAVLDGTFDLAATPGRNAVTLSIPALYPKPPEGASHFELLLALGCLPEHVYDADAKGYVPTYPARDAPGAFAGSDLLPLDGNGAAVLSAAFTAADLLPADVALAVALGVRFYQVINGVPYALEQGNAMKVVAVL